MRATYRGSSSASSRRSEASASTSPSHADVTLIIREMIMRFMKTTFAVAAVGLTLTLGACDEGLTDLNKNPNAPENVGPEFLFPQGTTLAVETIRGEWFDLHLASLWAQHYAKIQYVDEDWYRFRPEVNNAFWR